MVWDGWISARDGFKDASPVGLEVGLIRLPEAPWGVVPCFNVDGAVPV